VDVCAQNREVLRTLLHNTRHGESRDLTLVQAPELHAVYTVIRHEVEVAIQEGETTRPGIGFPRIDVVQECGCNAISAPEF